MKDARDTWCVQIDVTNMCEHKCANCTHLVKYAMPWRMSLETFRAAVDSLEGYRGVVGIIGGNPGLLPNLPEMIGYLQCRIPKERRGIFLSSFGKGNYLESQIREVFCPNQIYFGEHRSVSWHHPVLVASKDVVPDPVDRANLIENCWVLDKWSPSITPKGCYRCEIMGGFDMALHLNLGLPIEKGWLERPVSDFKKQFEAFCGRCGFCLPTDKRADSDCRDDVSRSNMDMVASVSGHHRVDVYDLERFDPDNVVNWFPWEYRKGPDKPVGVTISVNYANCLERILPFNLRHLESLIVVTSPDDIATKEVCSRYPNIRVIETDIFYRHGAKFNKGAAIEIALMSIPKDKWCLIFDADICFPADMFLLEALDKECLYGASRTLVYTEEQYDKATSKRNFDLSGLPQDPRDTGWFGMFQLFHPQASVLSKKRPWYGINYYNASWCDNIFQMKWPDAQRRILRELDPHGRATGLIRLLHLGHRNNWVGSVEGKFPRPETVYSKAEEEMPLSVSCEVIMNDIICEVQRMGVNP